LGFFEIITAKLNKEKDMERAILNISNWANHAKSIPASSHKTMNQLFNLYSKLGFGSFINIFYRIKLPGKGGCIVSQLEFIIKANHYILVDRKLWWIHLKQDEKLYPEIPLTWQKIGCLLPDFFFQ